MREIKFKNYKNNHTIEGIINKLITTINDTKYGTLIFCLYIYFRFYNYDEIDENY